MRSRFLFSVRCFDVEPRTCRNFFLSDFIAVLLTEFRILAFLFEFSFQNFSIVVDMTYEYKQTDSVQPSSAASRISKESNGLFC